MKIIVTCYRNQIFDGVYSCRFRSYSGRILSWFLAP